MKIKKYKNIISALLIFSLVALTFPQPARADAWGSNMMANIWQVTTEQILTSIKESLVASAKVVAIRIIQGRLNVLLTGSCGKYCIGGTGAMFITDWQDYIFGSAQRTSDRVVNDFFNGLRAGTTASMARVVTNAQNALDNEAALTKRPPDLQNYVSEGKYTLIFDPSTSNPWKAWQKAGEPQNDLAFIYLRGYSIKRESFIEQALLRSTKAKAYSGFTGTETKSSSYASGKYGPAGYGTENEGSEEGTVTLPGSIVKDLTAEVQGMGIKMIDFAKSIPEIVTGMVVQTLTNLINYGIKQITDPIDQQIMNFRNQVGTQVWNAQNAIQQGARENIYFNKKP